MAKRPKWSWTKHQEKRAGCVIDVTSELRDYWPLTLRQIYYRLVVEGHIENIKSQYTMLSTLVKWMRIDERLPWEALEDRNRIVTNKRGFEGPQEFVSRVTRHLRNGYARCLVQGQEKYVEVWVEKDALRTIFEKTVYPYCMRVVVCRGYNSVTFLADFYKCAEKAIMKGQEPVVLYFGDLDPSGIQMLEATITTLEDELGLCGVRFERVALNPEQIAQYDLPYDPYAAKPTDKRYKEYIQGCGKVAVELDALDPRDLEDMIRNSIEDE